MKTSHAFADKLSQATVEKHYHPIHDVDWSQPIDLDAEHTYLPERFVSVAGSDLYASMAPRERRLLSLHESVSYFSTGIWLENMLMYGFLYKLYAMDYADPNVRYMLHEVAEEAYHSIMFHAFVRKVGVGYAPVRWFSRLLGRIGSRQIPAVNPYLFFMAILAGEEPPDHFARAAREDERVHPLVRRITTIHTVEEARHIAYAREFLRERFAGAPRWQQAHARLIAPIAVRNIVGEFFTPRWPAGYGGAPEQLRFSPRMKAAIDDARRRGSAERRRLLRESVARVVGFFEEIGVITERSRAHWRRWGLVEA